MKIAKENIYRDRNLVVEDPELRNQLRRMDQDMTNLFLFSQGRVRFGDSGDGDRGENISGEWQVISDTGSADTEFSVTHTLGAVPVGYFVTKTNKGGVVYASTTAWTSSTIYLKCSAANTAITIFLLK